MSDAVRDAPAEGSGNRRAPGRERVIRAAKMLFGNTVIDCVVLDISAAGARVRTAAVVPVPQEVVLRLRSGAAFRARRCWARGTQIGLRYDAAAPLEAEAALIALAAFEALPPEGIDEAMRRLRKAEFLGDPQLGDAAVAAEAAYAAFRDLLRARLAVGRGCHTAPAT